MQQSQQGNTMYPQQVMCQQQQAQEPLSDQQPPQPVLPQQLIHSPQSQVLVIRSPSATSVRENYAATTSRALGLMQISAGIFAIAFQAILTGLGSLILYSGTGFWCGVFVSNSIFFFFILFKHLPLEIILVDYRIKLDCNSE